MNPVKERRVLRSLDERTREAGQMSANVAATREQAAQSRTVFIAGDRVNVRRELEGVLPATVVSTHAWTEWVTVTVDFDNGQRVTVEASRVTRWVEKKR